MDQLSVTIRGKINQKCIDTLHKRIKKEKDEEKSEKVKNKNGDEEKSKNEANEKEDEGKGKNE